MAKRKWPSNRILERIKRVGILKYIEDSAKKIPASGDFEYFSRLSEDPIEKVEKIKEILTEQEKINGD